MVCRAPPGTPHPPRPPSWTAGPRLLTVGTGGNDAAIGGSAKPPHTIQPARRGQDPGQRLEVVPASADRVTGHPKERQDRADHDHDDADCPDNGDLGDETDNEENDAENDRRGLLAAGSRDGGREYPDVHRPDDVHGSAGTSLAETSPAGTSGVCPFTACPDGAAACGEPDRRPNRCHLLRRLAGPLPSVLAV